jgi:hypothetical protein
VAQIAASIVEFGFNAPILVASDAGIVAGHGRLQAARKLGLGECPVVVLDHLGHPSRDTTISVREAARIQQFPDEYIFDCPYMDHVCNLIGNALPPGFAEIAAAQCARALRRHHRSDSLNL